MGLKLDLQYSIGEPCDVPRRKLLEGPIDSDVLAFPVVACASFAAKVVFSNQSQLCVQRDTHAGIILELEGSAAVKGTDGGAHLLGDDALLNLIGEFLH